MITKASQKAFNYLKNTAKKTNKAKKKLGKKFSKAEPLTKAMIVGSAIGIPVKAGFLYGAYKLGTKDNKKK
jgi:hypothetical protein